MNINVIEEALVAFRDKKVTDGARCTGLRIRVENRLYAIGRCWNTDVKCASKVSLNKATGTLTLSYCYESDDPRPRIELVDCGQVSGIAVESSRDAEVSTDGMVEIL